VQPEPHTKLLENSGVPEGYPVFTPNATLVLLIMLQTGDKSGKCVKGQDCDEEKWNTCISVLIYDTCIHLYLFRHDDDR